MKDLLLFKRTQILSSRVMENAGFSRIWWGEPHEGSKVRQGGEGGVGWRCGAGWVQHGNPPPDVKMMCKCWGALDKVQAAIRTMLESHRGAWMEDGHGTLYKGGDRVCLAGWGQAGEGQTAPAPQELRLHFTSLHWKEGVFGVWSNTGEEQAGGRLGAPVLPWHICPPSPHLCTRALQFLPSPRKGRLTISQLELLWSADCNYW